VAASAGLGKQAVAVLAAAAWAFVISFALAWAVRAIMGFRVATEVEAGGIDEAEHGETAYEYSPLSTTSRAVQAHALQEETAG
jgi:ammonium transporter, Amt family